MGGPGRSRSEVTGVIRLFAVVAGLLLVATALPSSASARNSASPGRIAYKYFVDDQFRQALIVTSDPDGKHRMTLTHPGSGQTDDYPIWAPDGASLIFTREDFNGCGAGCDTDDIYRVNSDGTGLVRVTDGTTAGVSSQFASFSPDGRQIAVQRVSFVDGNCCLSMILTFNSDGSGAVQLTSPDWATTGDFEPMWSPLGDEIAFTREIGYLFHARVPAGDLCGSRARRPGSAGDAVVDRRRWCRIRARRTHDRVRVLPRLLLGQHVAGLHDQDGRIGHDAAHA